MSPIGRRILVVDDAPEFLELLVPLLENEGYQTATATDGAAAVQVAQDWRPDVIVLDLSLPVLDGIEVCRRVRTFSDAYVVMLTSRSAEVDRVVGLEVGADDYVTKPFSPRELVARIRAMLRRPRQGAQPDTAPPPDDRYLVGDLTVDPAGRAVFVNGGEVSLTRIEFDLLATLASKPTMVFSRSMLQDLVWGPDWYGDDHVVDVHMANLRKKIDPAGGPSRIRTVRGVGYRMEATG